MTTEPQRIPPWILLPRTEGPGLGRVRRTLKAHGLGTVCEEARCPNRAECWGCGTATFLIMGRQCTRSCRFCSVRPGRDGDPLEPDEPERVAEAVAELGLRFAVITSVSRDDLPDGGAAHYARTIEAIRRRCPGAGVEALIPDYLGHDLAAVVAAGPDVLAHNLEVVRELTGQVRDRRTSYDRSLEVLRQARGLRPPAEMKTKSSLLLGLGETDEQIEAALDDLRRVEVDMVCLGQYLRPSRRHAPVRRYLPPERFDELAELARAKGFAQVASGPLVRTSYHAAELAGTGGRPVGSFERGGQGPGPGGRAPEAGTEAPSNVNPEPTSTNQDLSPTGHFIRAGLVPYAEALEWQLRLEGERLAGQIGDRVISLEHPPVITLGHKAAEANILADPAHLARLGVEVHRTTRGGDVTYHGPGQIVVYFIFNLRRARFTVAGFVERLEEAMIRTAADFGVVARRLEGRPGVFVGPDKIGAVGLHISRGVTTHGLAFNVDPDLSHYDLIVPCGLRDNGVTSLRRAAGREISLGQVEPKLIEHLAYLLRPGDNGDLDPGLSRTERSDQRGT